LEKRKVFFFTFYFFHSQVFDSTTDCVLRALKAGFRGVDTACQPKHYREDLVGEAIAMAISQDIVKRSDLFIQTKFTPIDGQDLHQPLPYEKHASLSEQVSFNEFLNFLC
jgi:diketogulonate reductase-like aldo/keto reductase